MLAVVLLLLGVVAESTRPVGQYIAFLQLAQVPPEYVTAVNMLRAARAVRVAYERPDGAQADGSAGAFNSVGSNVKDGRMVREDSSPMAHVKEAASISFPEPSFAHKLSPVMRAVVREVLAKGGAVASFRRKQGQILCDAADVLAPIEHLATSRMPPHVYFVAKRTRVLLMCALCESCDWPDVRLGERFVTGFPIAGGHDGTVGPEDSGVYRRVTRAAIGTVRGLARGGVTGHLSNQAWLGRVLSMLRCRAARAPAGSKQREAMEKCEELCEKEVRARRPTMEPGVSLGRLARWALQFGGLAVVRVVVSFAVRQGVRKDGSAKWRRIDDFKQNGLNAVTRTLETVTAISFIFPALVARAFVEEAQRTGLPCPPLWFGLDDLKSAYRVVPIMMPWLSVIAVWSFRRSRAVFYRLPGHAFGLVSSVVNFNRLPQFICFVCQVFLLVAVDHYVDDYCNVDVASAEQSAQDALELVHVLLGFDLEIDKRQHNAPSNTILGVLVSIATAHRRGGFATAQPTAERVQKVLAMLSAAASRKKLSPAEAGKLRGVLGFTLLPAMWKFGRAATQPLLSRCHFDRPPYRWNGPLRCMHDFFKRTLPVLPKLRVPMRRSTSRPVLVYSDASFSRRGGKDHAKLGFYVFDPVSGAEFWSKLDLPRDYYRFFARRKKTYITQAELTVAVAVWHTLPTLLRGRHVMHFIDNTAALSAIVNGYSRLPDCAAMVNSFHEAIFSLRSFLWAEYVPSAANPGDWPTRPEKENLIPNSATFVEMILPPLDTFEELLRAA